MYMKRLLAVAGLVALAACSGPGGTGAPAAGVKFDTSLPMNEFMLHVVDPAAQAYWRGAGIELTEAGEKDLSPVDEAGWEALVTAASTVAEAGNALQLQGRALAPEAEWNRLAQEMTARALDARKAADARDKQAVFDTGGRLYETCVACHGKYVIGPPETAKPLPDFPADVPAPK
jgi:hypothetical protein